MDDGAPRAVYFLSDYGTADEFAGVVRAVLFRLAPGVRVIDLSHEIPPFDVAAGAAMLERAIPHLGAGVVLAVVDPGVGTDRRAVAIRVDGPPDTPSWLVGPDNGLLVAAASALGGADLVVELAPRGGGATTFDGRDLFGPAAAHLARGGDPASIGTSVPPSTLVSPVAPPGRSGRDGPGSHVAEDTEDTLVASVTWIDRFGNVQLDLGARDLDRLGLAPGGWVDVEPEAPGQTPATHGHPFSARRVRSFAELEAGQLGVLVDANGHVALVFDRASAAGTLGFAGPGAQPAVRLRVARDDSSH
jgi:S-adenosyl-L-methionine hydrolase (adenosine-forming)